MKKRSAYWDNYKGILIFLVVFGHFIYSYAMKYNGSTADILFTFIYIFHMPAFVFCSGFFSKSARSRGREALLKLFLYYAVFNTLMMSYCYIFRGTETEIITPYNSYWYILAVIVWRMAAEDLSSVKGIIPLMLLVTLFMGYWEEFTNLLSVRRIFAFGVFFVAGYIMRRETVERITDNRKTVHWCIGVVFCGVSAAAVLWVVMNSNITLSMLLMSRYSQPGDILYRIFIIAAAFAAIVSMLWLMPDKEIPFLTKTGRNSLLIYLVHRFITLIYYGEFFKAADYSGKYLIYAFVASVITCLVFGGDRINGVVNGWFDRLAAAILDKTDGKGTAIRTVMVVIFVAILISKPLLQLTEI